MTTAFTFAASVVLTLVATPLAAQVRPNPLPSWEATLPGPNPADRPTPLFNSTDSPTKAHTLTGLAIGAGVSAAILAVLLATHCSDADDDTRCSGSNVKIWAVFVVPGALVGAIIGSRIRTNR